MSLYELRDIFHQYDGLPVLTIGNWHIAANTVTGIVGPNGSGKSTLLSLLGLVASPTRGVIRLNGRPVHPFCQNARGKIALLPQNSFLLKRSVFRNIAYGLKIQNHKSDIRSRVHQAMQMVGLDPDKFGQRQWYALSGGEARRVALASRLVLHPEVLLMDEPTTSVDATSAQMIKDAALHARRQWGTSLIITSHDGQWLADICDEILHMFRGMILGTGQQTLIFGPWQLSGQGGSEKILGEQQSFVTSEVPQDMLRSVAVVRADQLHIYPEKPPEVDKRLHCLGGMLVQLGLDNATGRILASIRIGSTIFSAYLYAGATSTSRFEPGQRVWVGYDPQCIEWY
jgi:tungstate transport system ATP-binding protein